MIDKQIKAAILSDFRPNSQPHKILQILSARKKPVSSSALKEQVTPNLSAVCRGQIDRRLHKHGFEIECRRIYGGDALWSLRKIEA